MEITKSNFRCVLPSIIEAINECDFIAIDTELTGLYSSRPIEHAFDTMEERYRKAKKQQCSQFLIIQFGMSCFKYHPDEDKFVHKDFNFYVFPRPHIRQAPDPRFLCQTSSLHFLASHGFDFNKTIYEGITYLTHAGEEKVRKYLATKYKIQRESLVSSKEKPKSNGRDREEIPEEHKTFIADIIDQVDSFISSEDETIIKLEPCDAYRRKLIYQAVEQKHANGIEMSSEVNENDERFIRIVKCTDQERLEKMQVDEELELDDIETAIGFRKVIDCLSESKKLILGHLMYLDILHIIDKFLFPLPESLSEFKDMVGMVFPNLLDSKYMASTPQIRSFLENSALATSLSNLSKAVQASPFEMPKLEPAPGFEAYKLDCGKYHEAGYDAFLCGLSYISMNKKLGSLASPPVKYYEPLSKEISALANRFHMRKHFDINCLNLSGPDPEPNRDNVFYVTFPDGWKTVDLVELFSPYGNIYVDWLDDVSALVALKNAQQAVKAKVGLVRKLSSVICVKPYSEYQKWANEQSEISEESAKKSSHVPETSAKSRKRSFESVGMAVIPEVNEADVEMAEEKTDWQIPKKTRKLKKDQVASKESSKPKIFEEEAKW